MNKEEYYKRIEKVNNRFKTDRVSADEEYQLVCQKNYLSTKYIEHLEQQCEKQKEVIDEIEKYIEEYQEERTYTDRGGFTCVDGHFLRDSDNLLEIIQKAKGDFNNGNK